MAEGSVKHIVLINGWSAPSVLWEPFFSESFESYTLEVLSLDEQTSIESCNEMIKKAIRPRTIIVGWSLGGQLAVNYMTGELPSVAESHQDVEAMILLQFTPCFVASENWRYGVDPEDLAALRMLVDREDLPKLVRRFSALMLSGSEYRKEDRSVLSSHYKVDSLPTTSCLSFGLDLLRDFDLRQSLPKLGLPILILLGEHDSLVQKSLSEWLVETLPSNTVSVKCVSGMGHFPCGSHAKTLKESIIPFLEDL